MIPAPDLVAALSEISEIDRPIVDRYWRNLRQAGYLPAGRGGRGGRQAMVGSKEAATLLIALLASDSAAGAPDSMAEISKFRGARLYYVCSSYEDDKERREQEVTVAPKGAGFVAAIANLIDLRRCPDILTSDRAGGFGKVSVHSAGGERWAEVEILHVGRLPRPGKFDPLHYSSAIFATGRAHIEAVPEIPRWAQFPAMRRTGEANSFVISDIADRLGDLSAEAWAALDWPKFTHHVYTDKRPPRRE